MTSRLPEKESRESFFEIVDSAMHNLNRTKKMFFIMIITAIILPAFLVMGLMTVMDTNGLEGPRQIKLRLLLDEFQRNEISQDKFIEETREVKSTPMYGGPNPGFYINAITIISTVFWVGYAIRQWLVLSKKNKAYLRIKKEKSLEHNQTKFHLEYSSNEKLHEMFFEIIDSAMHNLEKTKKVFLIIAIVALILPYATAAAIFVTIDTENSQLKSLSQNQLLEQLEKNQISKESFIKEIRGIGSPYGDNDEIKTVFYAHWIMAVATSALIFYAIRQWLSFAKWKKNYQNFKIKDDEINRKLDRDLGDE